MTDEEEKERIKIQHLHRSDNYFFYLKNIILLLVYMCSAWSLILRDEHRVLRRIFESERQ
jgi:hypothetical protein